MSISTAVALASNSICQFKGTIIAKSDVTAKGVASSKKRWCPVGPLNNQLGVRGAL